MPTFILQTKLAPEAVRSPRALERLHKEVTERIRSACPSAKCLPGRPEWLSVQAST